MGVAAKVIHRVRITQYSLLTNEEPNSDADSPASRIALHFYPLRVLAFVQLVYALLAFISVFEPVVDNYDVGTYLLITPAAGVLTMVSALLLFFCAHLGKPLLTYVSCHLHSFYVFILDTK